MITVFIEPHERSEAIEAYRDRLTPQQIDEISEAPSGAIALLKFGIGGTTRVVIIEEG